MLAIIYFSALWTLKVICHSWSSTLTEQKLPIYGLNFNSLLQPLERYILSCVQRSGYRSYCLGKENTLKNVLVLNDCQLLQHSEDKTGKPLVAFY